jgi:hypothetical protein
MAMVAVLGACGGGGGQDDEGAASVGTSETTAAEAPAEVAAAKDGCEYLTKAQVEAAIGAAVGEPQDTSTPSVGLCNYDSPDPILSVNTRIEHSGAGNYDATNAATAEMLKVEPKSEPGVGEKATWYFRNQMGVHQGQLTAAAGDALVTVTISGMDIDEPKAKAAAKTLAGQIISNL